MRILVLHCRYASGVVSGENRVVEDERRVLFEGGHEVDVWSPDPTIDDLSTRLRAGVDAVWSARADRVVEQRLAQVRPDVVHLHNLYPWISPSVIRTISRAAVPMIMTLHNYRLICLPATLVRGGKICEACVGHVPWRGVVHRCYRNSLPGSATLTASLTLHRQIQTFDRVGLFLAVSEFVRRKHVGAGMSEERIKTKPHFAWPTERREGAGEYFLYVGRLSPEKGVSSLVRAWKSEFGRLLIVGDGPQREHLRRLATSAGISFLGPAEPDKVAALVSRARAIVVPSSCYEGAGRTVIEAYAAGVPVIASDLGGLPEVVRHGRSGVLVRHDDLAAWRRAFQQLGDDSESQRLGGGAHDLWSSEFTPARGLRNLEAAYERASSSPEPAVLVV
jgi:glycosyltransferase involved in cell wall biosynthesis